MVTADRLLERGYFPRELPPPFSTASLATAVANGSYVPSASPDPTELLHHNLARAGSLRRRLSIPNPVWHVHLCQAMEANWSAICAQFGKSRVSLSAPRPDARGVRALLPRVSHAELARYRARARATCRYAVIADISQFYPSIYTHSIPWSFHTRSVAKAQQRNLGLLGNLLDKLVRGAQSGQTMGIPIGPDTSLALAEALLSPIDAVLQPLVKRRQHLMRHVDDCEATFKTLGGAEDFIGTIQSQLGELELALNPRKTMIRDLPLPLDAPWARLLRSLRLRPSTQGQASDLVALFDHAFEQAKFTPDEAVLRYVCSRVNRQFHEIAKSNWPMLTSLLCQATMADAGVLPIVVEIVRAAANRGWKVPTTIMGDLVSAVIERHSPLGHGSELAWALWLAMVVGAKIDPDAHDALAAVDDAVVALLALDAKSRGLLPSGFDTSKWAASMTGDELQGRGWLLSYEALVQGWLPPVATSSHVAANPDFAAMQKAGVSFYAVHPDPKAVPYLGLSLFAAAATASGSGGGSASG